MRYEEPLFRPPAEAESLIFQVAFGCPHNRCRFCGMYKTVKYRLRPEAEVLAEIAEAGEEYPETRRIFLADGDVMALPFDRLKTYLEALNAAFPRLCRINVYANGSSIGGKRVAQLEMLRKLKLHTLYMGLESGSQEVLDLFGKTERVDEMIAASVTAQKLGFRCSVMILIGLGGKTLREEHIRQTASALNRMQPALLSALRFIPVPGLALPEGFSPVTEYQAVGELREIISRLELNHTVFRANHTSNPVPLAGRLPQDREALCGELSRQLASGALDRRGPGDVPLFL